jgi:hypothetical protein
MSFRRVLNCLCAALALLTSSAPSISAANSAPLLVPPDCDVVAVVCVLREAGTLGNQYRLINFNVVCLALRLELPMDSF